MEKLSPVPLAGKLVRLEPLTNAHITPLALAAAESRATYAYTDAPDGVGDAERWVAEALDEQARGVGMPWAIVDARANRVVGSSRYYDYEHWQWRAPHRPPAPLPLGPDAMELGRTWLAASAQRTGINTEAKLLLLGHAFETLRVRRVTLKTDLRNQRSRNAIERLGFRLDGVWRAWGPSVDGIIRDVVYFSMLREEWPAARARLEERQLR
jgi:RimJ/RimL family protein N-acetyltransferase